MGKCLPLMKIWNHSWNKFLLKTIKNFLSVKLPERGQKNNWSKWTVHCWINFLFFIRKLPFIFSHTQKNAITFWPTQYFILGKTIFSATSHAILTCLLAQAVLWIRMGLIKNLEITFADVFCFVKSWYSSKVMHKSVSLILTFTLWVMVYNRLCIDD